MKTKIVYGDSVEQMLERVEQLDESLGVDYELIDAETDFVKISDDEVLCIEALVYKGDDE
ncbi:hypothetical protein [Levilactobacillus brevis]|uniref:hypothetical protein n=1 Tax=Levilactobacillus brevis TaxID=1580 RepID=UPI003B50553B